MIARAFQAVIARKNAGGASALLLDTYTALAAYSLRKLRTAYSGSAIRVRRSSDNAEQDIGFSGEALDESALTTFVGANDGYITKWYDQSGGSQGDYAQTTASRQWQIVASGAVIKSGGIPAPTSAGNGGYERAASSYGATQFYTVINTNDGAYVFLGNGAGTKLAGTAQDGFTSSPHTGAGTPNYRANGAALSSPNRDDLHAQWSISANVLAVAENVDVSGWSTGINWFLYPAAPSFNLSGICYEIIEASDTTDRAGIEGNLASHYGITL